MAVLDEISVDGQTSAILSFVAKAFWDWFDNHQDQKVKTIKIWFISKTVYVRDLRDIFTLLFGAHP